MQYSVGSIGKVIVLRLESGEPVYASIEMVAERESVDNGIVWILGGVKNGGIVVGPKDPEKRPIEPIIKRFEDHREIVGFGTLFKNQSGTIKLHMHASVGNESTVITGCPREGLDCWLVNEIVILELVGVDAKRVRDEQSGFELLKAGTLAGI